MSANGQLSHSPPTDWKCYSSSGAGGAGSSNLALGTDGIGAINIYMDDWGSNNYPVGHRRWLQNPNTGTFATGDVPGANSLAVWLGGSGSGMPARGFISWPTSGYFPAQNLPGSNRWSFSLPSGGFSSSTQISMRNMTDGVNYTANIQPFYDGFGLPTIVWEPQGFSANTSGRDVTIRVSITGLSSTPSSYTYDVILFNAQ
jgi:hypothetical protein